MFVFFKIAFMHSVDDEEENKAISLTTAVTYCSKVLIYQIIF